jgi:YebC/PmpR family DNA-binding regulatory protein
MAAKAGGPDPNGNASLRLALLKAKENNMPADIVDRAIAKAVGDADSSQLAEILYEGYGPGGTAVMIEAVTDNRNRTVADIRNVFTRGGGNLGESGSVAWQFATRGVISLDLGSNADGEEVALVAIDAGAEDFSVDEDSVAIYTKPEDLMAVRQSLVEAGHEPSGADIERVPTVTVSLEEKEALQALRLLDKLEDLDDVQRVYSNADFPDAVLASYTE